MRWREGGVPGGGPAGVGPTGDPDQPGVGAGLGGESQASLTALRSASASDRRCFSVHGDGEAQRRGGVRHNTRGQRDRRGNGEGPSVPELQEGNPDRLLQILS